MDFTFKLRFKFHHPAMEMQNISEELNLQPFVEWSAGMQRRTRTGLVLDGTYDTGYWCSEGYVGSADQFDDALTSLLSKLEGHRVYFNRVRDTGGTAMLVVAVFLGSESGGPLIEREQVKRISDLGFSLGFDIYGPENSKECDELSTVTDGVSS